MVYVVVFVAGVAAGAGPLVIWYFHYLSLLRTEKQRLVSWNDRLKTDSSNLSQRADDFESRKRDVDEAVEAFEARKVQYDALLGENNSLKQDLFNLSIQLKKTERDHAAISRRQEEIDRKANELAGRYLDENVSWIANKLTARNFATCKDRLTKVVSRCRDIGFDIPEQKEQELVQDLRRNFEQAVRAEFQREEQSRIKAQVREEERLAREIEKQKQNAEKQKEDAERAKAAIQAAVEKALKEGKDEHSAEVEYLKAQLKEAEEAAQKAEEEKQRAISRAQTTKSGHVYVLSNIGSFGESVFKIGMTRRDDQQKRVKELGDASVPFPFDVHMMIPCNDAPALENALHREFHKQRVNRVNFRKEFFRVDLESIRRIVEAQHGEVDYVAGPEALEYRESLDMTDEDYEFVEKTVQSVWDDEDAADADE